MYHNPLDSVIPSAQEAKLSETLRAALADGQHFTMSDLPPRIAALLMDILIQTAAGNAVTLVPVGAEVTTQQAADLLNVSQRFVAGLVERGTLPARGAGEHPRLPLTHVLAYKADQFIKGQQALDEILAFDQEFGLL